MTMFESIFWLVVAVISVVLFYRHAKNKDGFVRLFSRHDYMSELNKKMEKKQ